MENFYKDLSRGKVGEQYFKDTMAARGHKVIDVSDDKYYQSIDVDFILERNGQRTTVEVKTDYRSQQTGNFFIELERPFSKGWFYYCQARYLAFVQPDNNLIYIVARKDIEEHLDQCRFAYCGQIKGALLPVGGFNNGEKDIQFKSFRIHTEGNRD